MADDKLYESFVKRKRSRFVQWAQIKLGSLEDAREVANEAFFKLYLRWNDALASASTDAFAFKILKDGIADALRKRDRTPCALIGLEYEPGMRPVAGIPNEEIERISSRMEVHQAIAELPSRQQICVTLYYLLEVSTEEIADLTGMVASTVRSHLASARTTLAATFVVPPPTPAHEKGS